MVRLILLMVLAAVPALADPVSFRETFTIEGKRFTVPMEVSLAASNESDVVLTFRGDLTPIQRAMPALLSREITNTCEERTAIAVTQANIDNRDIVIHGQLQHRRWRCRNDNIETRKRLIHQTAAVALRLTGEISDGCLKMSVVGAKIAPDGLSGALLNVTGLTDRITRDLTERLDASLKEDENCLKIPSEFRAFDTRITGGGFRDQGDGEMGAVIHGAMRVNATNFIRLVHMLGREGRIGD